MNQSQSHNLSFLHIDLSEKSTCSQNNLVILIILRMYNNKLTLKSLFYGVDPLGWVSNAKQLFDFFFSTLMRAMNYHCIICFKRARITIILVGAWW